MVLVDLIPYWKDPICEKAEPNTIDMKSMFLLTGPNGGGKSSILRSVCAAALLSVCGLMVPARDALVPRLDAIMLRMMSTDSPADNKSSFQMVLTFLAFFTFLFLYIFFLSTSRNPSALKNTWFGSACKSYKGLEFYL